jgi:Fic family protein
VQLLTPPSNERDLLIYRWKEALNSIYYNCFFRQEMMTDDVLYEVYRILQPNVRYQPFQELPEYIRYAMSEDHPVTRAALLQCFIYNIKPFPQYNEPFSHLAFQTALLWSGWDFRGLICIEEQYFHDRAYYKELIANTFASGNVTQWIEYVSECLMKQLEQIISSYSLKQASGDVKNELFILNDRQKKILMILDDANASISNRELQKLTNISQMTAARDLSKLVEFGLIQAHGKGRGIRYTRN